MLREDLILIDADSSRLSAKLGVEPAAPHRIDMLRFFPDGEPVTDTRVTRPPSAGSGPVPGQVPGVIEDAYAKFSLVGLTAAGNAGSGAASDVWTSSRGWADLERNVPLGPGHRGARAAHRRPHRNLVRAGGDQARPRTARHVPEHGPHHRGADQSAVPRPGAERRAGPRGHPSSAWPAALCAAGHAPGRRSVTPGWESPGRSGRKPRTFRIVVPRNQPRGTARGRSPPARLPPPHPRPPASRGARPS